MIHFFKNLFLVGNLLILASCATDSPKVPTKGYIEKAQKQWQAKLEEEDVSYVKLNQRIPSALSKYQISGDCGGLPRVRVKTAPGFCLGLIDSGEGLGMPRAGLAINQNQILITDMGSWQPETGAVHLLTWNGKAYVRQTILNAKNLKEKTKRRLLDRPHAILLGPDGKVYIGAAGVISTFDPLANDVEATLIPVIDGLPKEGLHPLKNMTFDMQGKQLFINVGASTNVCQKYGIQGQKLNLCKDSDESAAGEAHVRVYQLLPNGQFNANYKIYAKGLRNSMGLWWDTDKNVLVQVENSRDAINKFDTSLDNASLPHEEFNVLQEGKHYGWPYCYENVTPSPEWSHIDCQKFEKPYLLLPAHSAPLGLLKYSGDLFPAWYKRRYIISFHGYMPTGHRIVTYKRNDQGLPVGQPLSLVYGWDSDGEQLQGSPVGISEMHDGSLLIVEDKSRKVLRLFYNQSEGDGQAIAELNEASQSENPGSEAAEAAQRKNSLDEKLRAQNSPIFSQIQSKLFDKHCVACHGGASAPGIRFKPYDDVTNAQTIIARNKAQEIYNRISSAPGWPMMPPQGIDDKAELEQLKNLILQWIQQGTPIPE